MTPIEHHWSLVRTHLLEQPVTDEQLAFMRELFFGGCLSMLAILAELNHRTPSDKEFDEAMNELYREASSGVLERYKDIYRNASVRKH
jgi:hypothetical protein